MQSHINNVNGLWDAGEEMCTEITILYFFISSKIEPLTVFYSSFKTTVRKLLVFPTVVGYV